MLERVLGGHGQQRAERRTESWHICSFLKIGGGVGEGGGGGGGGINKLKVSMGHRESKKMG